MTQKINAQTRLAANAIRESAGACHQGKRQVGCDYCFSKRYRGCVFLAEAVIDALFPVPGEDGGGTPPGIKQRKAA